MLQDQLQLADFLLIGEAILSIDASRLRIVAKLPAAESALAAPFASFDGNYFYPHPVQRAAICCSRVIRNHPLPDGNKRVGYECMREMLERSEIDWPRPTADAEEIAFVIDGLAASAVAEGDFISWAQARTRAD